MRRISDLGLCAAFCAAFAAACSDGDEVSGPTGNETYTREKLMDPETCAECHPKHYEEWSGSMHAYASEDPVFLAMNRRGQEETGGELEGFCVNCHAPLAVREGATSDGLDMESVPKHLQGITCYFCHQVADVEEGHLHNNPLLLADDVTMRGGVKDPVKSGAHKSEYSALFDSFETHESSKMCGTCHDIVIPGHFSGAAEDVVLERTYAEWQETVFAQQGIGRQSCNDCHLRSATGVPEVIAEPPKSSVTMPQRPVRHPHHFAAIDTALTDFPHRDEQLALVQEGLDAALLAELCVGQPVGHVTLRLENLLAGHNFPSGATQDRRLWAEIHVYDGDRDAFQVGVVPPGGRITDEVDANAPGLWFWDRGLKLDGSDAHMFWDVASVEREGERFGSILGSQPGVGASKANAVVRTLLQSQTRVLMPTRVTLSVWLEPVGLDVIDDLMKTGHLADDSVRNAMPRHYLQKKRLVDPDAGPILLDWSRDAAYSGTDGALCVTTEGT